MGTRTSRGGSAGGGAGGAGKPVEKAVVIAGGGRLASASPGMAPGVTVMSGGGFVAKPNIIGGTGVKATQIFGREAGEYGGGSRTALTESGVNTFFGKEGLTFSSPTSDLPRGQDMGIHNFTVAGSKVTREGRFDDAVLHAGKLASASGVKTVRFGGSKMVGAKVRISKSVGGGSGVIDSFGRDAAFTVVRKANGDTVSVSTSDLM